MLEDVARFWSTVSVVELFVFWSWKHWDEEVLSFQTPTWCSIQFVLVIFVQMGWELKNFLSTLNQFQSPTASKTPFSLNSSSYSTIFFHVLSIMFNSFPSVFVIFFPSFLHFQSIRPAIVWARPCGVLQGDPQVAPLLSVRLQDLLPKAGPGGPDGPWHGLRLLRSLMFIKVD